jgi:Tfp pilus assembly major pilin PilA
MHHGCESYFFESSSMKQKQQGITFIGLIVTAALVGCIGVVGMQAFPGVVEYMAVQKAVQKASSGNTVAEVRSIFDKIDDISSIAGTDLDITKAGDKVVVGFSYQREIHLAGPAFLVMKYKGSSR